MAKTLPAAVTAAQTAGKTVLELTGDNEDKYYFVKPGAKDIERFIATATKGKATQAVRNLVIEMALAPTGEELATEFKENPGRMVALNSALQASVGMNEDFTAKKL
jgi:hypothetical protein